MSDSGGLRINLAAVAKRERQIDGAMPVMPWCYNRLSDYLCEIVSADCSVLVGHIRTDCIQQLDDVMIRAGYKLPMPRIHDE